MVLFFLSKSEVSRGASDLALQGVEFVMNTRTTGMYAFFTQRSIAVSCAGQDPFLFSVLPEKRNGSSALPQMPLAGLFHDGPPRARLRSGRAAFFCHRQRRLVRPKRKGRQRA